MTFFQFHRRFVLSFAVKSLTNLSIQLHEIFLRYFYESYTDDLSKAVQRAEIEKSLREWSEVADISFVEVLKCISKYWYKLQFLTII